ncbi:MAG: PhnD/SsuA/transferrin family substrate-binding protein [Planctomycetes bacterium]|nr:PhnD/SsuA/transferrin family substrate-binding protein [Planctomycetota bacterium]
MRIAELPWYDVPELVPATDALWRGIARHLRASGIDRVPDGLMREGSYLDHWRDPDLLLSQACGYDVLYDSAPDLEPIATPCYFAEGCEGPRYRSIVVVRADRPFRSLEALRGGRLAINQATSHSGTNALRPLLAPLARDGRFFAAVEETGSHTDSLAAVQDGAADVAGIDAVVLALLRRVRPAAVRGLRPIACTQPALAPPFVTSRRSSPGLRAALRRALRAAFDDPELAPARGALLLGDVVFLPGACYDELAAFEEPALEAGYLELPAPALSPLARGRAVPRRGTAC